MDLKELIKDLDYQKEFDYEKRVDLFNKYSYSTTHDFFVPIFELACYIDSLVTCGSNETHYYGHGQKILNTSLTDNVNSGKEKRIEFKANYVCILLGGSRIKLSEEQFLNYFENNTYGVFYIQKLQELKEQLI